MKGPNLNPRLPHKKKKTPLMACSMTLLTNYASKKVPFKKKMLALKKKKASEIVLPVCIKKIY